MQDQVLAAVEAVRQKSPLVHNITNFVVMQVTANALLAAGASPLMAHEPEELDDLLSIASALVLNIGTLDKAWIASMRQAGELAGRRRVPVVLDPVGAGASRLRTSPATKRPPRAWTAPAPVTRPKRPPAIWPPVFTAWSASAAKKI